MPDLTTPETQVRLIIGEFVITICQLEAQKARLEAEKADLVRQLAEAIAPQVMP